MAGSDQEAKALAGVLQRAAGVAFLPAHVVYRVAVLIGDEPVVYADGDVELVRPSAGADSLRGRVVVLTARAVIEITLDGTTARPAADDSATVTVVAWPRSALREIAIDPSANSDDDWAQAQSMPWPRGASMRLTYAGRAEPLVLPLSAPGGDPLADLATALVSDMTADA